MWMNYDKVYISYMFIPYPIGSMYGIFTYIYHKNQPNVAKYTIHGSYTIKINRMELNIPYMDPMGIYMY